MPVVLVALTNFADQGVILPVAVITAFVLAALGWFRGALAWVGMIVVVLMLIGVGKILIFSCLLGWPVDWSLRSPSGHTASAAIVYGSLFGLLMPFRRRHVTTVIFASIFAVIVGASRVLLDQHTVTDVIAGGVVGILGALALVWIAGPRPETVYRRRLIMLAVPLGVALFYGSHVHAEPWIGAFARSLRPFAQCNTTIGLN